MRKQTITITLDLREIFFHKMNKIRIKYQQHVSGMCIDVFLKNVQMEAGFGKTARAEEKKKFYEIVELYSELLSSVIELFGETEIYVGNFCSGKNYKSWKDMNRYDAYRSLRKILGRIGTIKIGVNEKSVMELILECNFRYFSNVTLFFPKHEFFVKADEHSYLAFMMNEKDQKLLQVFLKDNELFAISKPYCREEFEY